MRHRDPRGRERLESRRIDELVDDGVDASGTVARALGAQLEVVVGRAELGSLDVARGGAERDVEINKMKSTCRDPADQT